MSHAGVFFDKAGQPITVTEFVEKCEDPAYRTVGYDIDRDHGIAVSTVWLGVSMSLAMFGPPVIFETMILGGPYDFKMMRYSLEADALQGHQRTIEDILAGRRPWFLDDEPDDAAT